MYLTEELLTEWTGLTGRELSIFYLTYKKHAACALLHNDLEYIKQDIIKFGNYIYQNYQKDKLGYKRKYNNIHLILLCQNGTICTLGKT